MECKPVDHEWVVIVLGLEKSSSSESMESSDQGVSSRATRKEDRWHEVAREMIDRRGIQKMSGQRSRVGKQKAVNGRAESWTSTSDSELEEGQFRDFGVAKGECSRPKCRGNISKSDGLPMDYGYSENEPYANCGDGPNLTFGLQEEGNQSSCGNGLGGQISGKDFVEVPLAVEIEGMEQSEPQGFANKEVVPKTKTVKCYWSLEEEITKVIEKGVALGHIVTSKANVRGQEQQSGVKCLSNTGWNLEEEVTKVIEVAIALGFDFNGKEDETGEQIARREMEDEERMREGNGK
ncbi:hypothetical protein Q3G72_031097 [Acer saccharum]|nr:hypothetical protein Q3G72_031097 [Acer saccharum]